jgi:hypothetical protein
MAFNGKAFKLSFLKNGYCIQIVKKDDTPAQAHTEYHAHIRLLSFPKKEEWANKRKCYCFALL